MTWDVNMSDEKKKKLRNYHCNYNKDYYSKSNSMKKSKKLYEFKRRYIIPENTLKMFGNDIPYLYNLQNIMEFVSPDTIYKFLTLSTKLEFENVSK